MDIGPVIDNPDSDRSLTHLAALLMLISETADQKIPSLAKNLLKTHALAPIESLPHLITPLSSFLTDTKKQLESLLKEMTSSDFHPKEKGEGKGRVTKTIFEASSKNRSSTPAPSKNLEKKFVSHVKLAIQTLTKLSDALETQEIKDTIKKLRPLFEKQLKTVEKEASGALQEIGTIHRLTPMKKKPAAQDPLAGSDKKDKRGFIAGKKSASETNERIQISKKEPVKEIAPKKSDIEQRGSSSANHSLRISKKIFQLPSKAIANKNVRPGTESNLNAQKERLRIEEKAEKHPQPLRFDRMTIPSAPFTAAPPFAFSKPKRKRKTFWFREEEEEEKQNREELNSKDVY